MIKHLMLLPFMAFAFNVSAHSDLTMPPKNPKAQTTKPPLPNSTGEYGEVKFLAEDAQAMPQAFTEDEIIIKTNVTEVCPKKGCWMKIKGNAPSEELRVTFKDYGFFVPTNLVGKEVALKGRYVKHVETVDEQKHLLKDAKRPQAEIEAVTKPKETLRFVATGVKDLSSSSK